MSERMALNDPPRVVLLTRDGAYSRLFRNCFVEQAQVEIVGVVNSSSFLHRGRPLIGDLAAFVWRVGVVYALYQAYVAWILPYILRAGPRLAVWARQHRIPYCESNDINDPEMIAWLGRLEADYFLSFHFNQKIAPVVTALPTRACVNYHPSDLPAWRGVDPVFFALKEGAMAIGGSVHLVDEDIDVGDVLSRTASFSVSRGSLISNNIDLFVAGARLAAEVINDFDFYIAKKELQGADDGQYFSWADIGRTALWDYPWRIR